MILRSTLSAHNMQLFERAKDFLLSDTYYDTSSFASMDSTKSITDNHQDSKMFYEDQSNYVLNNDVKEDGINCEQNATSSFEHGSMMSQQQLVSQDAQQMNAILEQSSTSSTETASLNQANEKKQGKPKRTRTAYSSTQLMQLEAEFQNGRYLCRSRRIQISALLSLTEKQIKVWFQNRRMKYKKDTKADIKSFMANDQSELASYSRDTSTCGAKHIFNMPVNNLKPLTSMMLNNNNMQAPMPCAYPGDMLQNGLSTHNYGIIDQQQQLKQEQQNYSGAIGQQQQIYNVLPDQSYSHQQQSFYPHRQITDYSASYYPEPQMDDNNLLQQQWRYDCMQNNSNVNAYIQVESGYADADIISNIPNDISNQVMSTLMSESEENRDINSVSTLPSFSSWFTGDSNQLMNENTAQLANTDPASQNINSNLLSL